jgi:hypothetical protein
MEKRFYSLGINENSNLVRIIRLIFGIVCIAVAVFWLIFNIKSLKSNGTLWVTIIFLTGFGLFQIWSGLGRAARFIEFDQDSIRLKKNAIFAPALMKATEIERIELFPMNLIFFLKLGSRIMFRFGATYNETNEKIKEEILSFSDSNNIPIEIIEEKL